MTKIAALKCIAAAGTVLICCALSTVPAAAACPDSKGEAASGCETFLIVELDGVNSRIQLFEVLGKLRSRFGDKAFPTRPYTVRPNDTLCSIYNEQAKLPVNAAACPRAAESLNRMLNGKSARLRPNAEIRIPDVKIETYRQYAVQQIGRESRKKGGQRNLCASHSGQRRTGRGRREICPELGNEERHRLYEQRRRRHGEVTANGLESLPTSHFATMLPRTAPTPARPRSSICLTG